MIFNEPSLCILAIPTVCTPEVTDKSKPGGTKKFGTEMPGYPMGIRTTFRTAYMLPEGLPSPWTLQIPLNLFYTFSWGNFPRNFSAKEYTIALLSTSPLYSPNLD